MRIPDGACILKNRSYQGLIGPLFDDWIADLNVPTLSGVSADDVCPFSAILVEPTPVKTIPELFRPAFWVRQRTGDVESVDPDKPG